MLSHDRRKLFVVLIALLLLIVFSAYAEPTTSTLEELEKYTQENFNRFTYNDFLWACYDQKGWDYTREKVLYYYSLYPDNPDIAEGVLMYCDPFSEPERIIEAGETMLRTCDLPVYSEDMEIKPDEYEVGYYSSAYVTCAYAYYQVGDEEKLVDAGDWVISYAGYNEEQFRYSLSVADYVTLHFIHNNDEVKALSYARQVESLLSKYGDQYSTIVEQFLPEYEITFVPILEKYAQSQGQ
jgi:hypothetical protein